MSIHRDDFREPDQAEAAEEWARCATCLGLFRATDLYRDDAGALCCDDCAQLPVDLEDCPARMAGRAA